MAIFHVAYFDASGKGLTFPALSVAGAIAPVGDWSRLVCEWEGALEKEHVTEFHMSDFAPCLGEYKDWKDDAPRKRRFLEALLAIIAKYCKNLFSITVEADAWKEINSEFLLEERFYSPFALAGLSVIMQCQRWAGDVGAEPIEFIFEDGEDIDDWRGLRKLCARIGVEPQRLSKRRAVPCQIGDLIAWKSRIAATNALIKLGQIEAATFPDFESFNGILAELESMWRVLPVHCRPGVYSPDALRRTCRDSKVQKRSEAIISLSET